MKWRKLILCYLVQFLPLTRAPKPPAENAGLFSNVFYRNKFEVDVICFTCGFSYGNKNAPSTSFYCKDEYTNKDLCLLFVCMKTIHRNCVGIVTLQSDKIVYIFLKISLLQTDFFSETTFKMKNIVSLS